MSKKRDLERVCYLGMSSRSINRKEEPTRRANWMLKYKKGSMNVKFRNNIIRNVIVKAIKSEAKLKLGSFEIRADSTI